MTFVPRSILWRLSSTVRAGLVLLMTRFRLLPFVVIVVRPSVLRRR